MHAVCSWPKCHYYTTFDCTLRSGIVGSSGNSIFYFLGKCHTIFHRGCTISYSYQKMYKDSNFSIAFSALVIFWVFVLILFYSSHSSGCDVVSNHGFDLHFLMISDAELSLMFSLAISISTLDKCVFESFVHF